MTDALVPALPLAALFPPAREADWRSAVDKALKGGDFTRKLVNRSADGFSIQPLYPPRKVGAGIVAGRAAGERWRITQRVDHPAIDAANSQAIAELEGGADGLSLVFAGAGTARGFGLAVETLADLGAALEGVFLDLALLRLEHGPLWQEDAALLAALVSRQGVDPALTFIDFGFDPIGSLARTGTLASPWSQTARQLGETASGLSAKGFKGPFISCDARPVHEAGGSEGQELAFALACAVAYLRALESNGWALGQAERALSFTLAVDADQFMGLAKLRALRKLMVRVQEACGLSPKPIHIHAETAWRMLTRHDAPVNMLRNSIAVFAAGVGGADSICVLPHSAAQGFANPFARRLARNTQHVLLEEAHLWRVSDPAAGSGGIEALTDDLCASAWAQFQDIEKAGGIVTALETGFFQGAVAETSMARAKAIATRRQPITGTSEFPNLDEKPADIDPLSVKPVIPGPAGSASITCQPLPSSRASEPFEALRDRSDAALVKNGQRPRVFLANLGPASAFTARSAFAKGVFEAGGIEAVGNDGFWPSPSPGKGEGWGGGSSHLKKTDPHPASPLQGEVKEGQSPPEEVVGMTDLIALTEAFKASGTKLVCLCSSDANYAAEAIAAARALVAAGAQKIHIAGRLPDMEAALAGAGVSGAIFAGCDVLAVLREALDVAGS
jgi:methylmalonyl-CoA mutase